MLGNEGAILIADAMMDNVVLKSLNLGNIKVIRIANNKIDDKGAKSISQMLNKNKSLKELYLGSNKINNEGMKLILNEVKDNNILAILDIRKFKG